MNDKDFVINRHPIYMGPHTVILVSVFTSTDNIEDIWQYDYVNHIKDDQKGAKELVSRISEHCSVNMLWELRKALAEEIEAHNKEFGTKFPMDSPDVV